MSDHVTRQVTLVTGVGGDIGTATSGRLALKSAHVAVCDLNAGLAKTVVDDACWRDLGAKKYVGDICSRDEAAGLVKLAWSERGHNGASASNAGIKWRGAIFDVTAEVRAATFAVMNTASQWRLDAAPAHIVYNNFDTLLRLDHVEPRAEVSAPITLRTADEAPSPCSAAVEVTGARAVA